MTDVNMTQLKKIIEDSQDLPQAAKKAGISRNSVYYHLNHNGLKVIKRLKVVKK